MQKLSELVKICRSYWHQFTVMLFLWIMFCGHGVHGIVVMMMMIPHLGI